MKKYAPISEDSNSLLNEPMATYGVDMNALKLKGMNALMQIDNPVVLKEVVREVVRALDESRHQSVLCQLAQIRIAELGGLPQGWDGDEALPVFPEVLVHAKEIIYLHDFRLLQSLEIMPDTNGTLLFEYETVNGKSVLNLGRDSISYFIKPKAGANVMKKSVYSRMEIELFFNQLNAIIEDDEIG